VTETPAAELSALSLLSAQHRTWGIVRAHCEAHPDEDAARVASFIAHGARIVGGEPDATPDHVRALLATVPQAAHELRRPSVVPVAHPSSGFE